MSSSSRRALVAAAVVAAMLVAVVAVATVRSIAGTPAACSLPPPQQDLPARLRTLGDFDQPYDASDPRVLEDAAARVGAALYTDLTGVTAAPPVAVAHAAPARYDAVVGPLTLPQQGGAVTGLVAFLRDCAGRAWYSDTTDLRRTEPQALPQRWPPVDAAAAARALGGSAALVYTASPFQPEWRRSGSATPAA